MELAANLGKIQERIRQACQRVGRGGDEVELMGVSKGQPPERVKQLADAGLRVFGENKVQEGKLKIGACPAGLEWHMIGHLQSNKVRDAVHFFRMIQSVDSFSLAEELQKAGDKQSKEVRILLEVNVAGESAKFGFRPDETVENLLRINGLPRLEIYGLMTIAPWSPEPERSRPFFRALRELKTECEQALGAPLPALSMGMSGDFEVAIEEGSTLVRIGTALFGPRRSMGRAGNETP